MKQLNIHGTFRVTTADSHGTLIKDLGVHTGFLDEIAFALAAECSHVLNFKLVGPMTGMGLASGRSRVTVALDYDSGTWQMPAESRAAAVRDALASREVDAEASNYYGAVTLVLRPEDPRHPQRQEEHRKAMLVESAKGKLTADELAALTESLK